MAATRENILENLVLSLEGKRPDRDRYWRLFNEQPIGEKILLIRAYVYKKDLASRRKFFNLLTTAYPSIRPFLEYRHELSDFWGLPKEETIPLTLAALQDHSKVPTVPLKADMKPIDSWVKLTHVTFGIFAATEPRKPEEKRALEELLTHVLRGEQTEAEMMITTNPQLLLLTGIGSDCSHQRAEGTALGMALAAEDVAYHDDEECMVEMLKKNIRKFFPEESENIITQQICKQFPEGFEDIEKEKIANDKEKVKAAFEAIKRAPENDDCKEVLEAFQASVPSKETMTTGKYFNIEMLLEAYYLYDLNYRRFNGKREFDLPGESDKNNLAWNKIVRYLEFQLPACYRQVMIQNPINIYYKGQKLQRSPANSGKFSEPLHATVKAATGAGAESWAHGLNRVWERKHRKCLHLRQHHAIERPRPSGRP